MKNLMILALVAVVACAFAGDITRTGQMPGDMYSLLNNVSNALMYRTMTDPSLVTVNSTAITFNAFTYVNNGVFYAKAEAGTSLNLGVDARLVTLNASSTRYYLLQINSAGTISMNAGTSAGYNLPYSGYTPFAGIKITTKAGGSYRPGVSAWSSTSVNSVIEDLSVINRQPGAAKLQGL